MSGSMLGRVLRPVVLLAAGMLIAQTTISVAATSPRPLSTQSRSVSCAGLDFHPIDSDTTYEYTGSLLHRRAGQAQPGSGFFLCDPHLPDRAVITKVQFTLSDDFGYSEVRYCGLERSGLTASTAATIQTIGGVSSTGRAATPGKVRRSTTNISHATVDNTRWGYWLQCQIAFDPDAYSTNTGIYGADIIFTISSANG